MDATSLRGCLTLSTRAPLMHDIAHLLPTVLIRDASWLACAQAGKVHETPHERAKQSAAKDDTLDFTNLSSGQRQQLALEVERLGETCAVQACMDEQRPCMQGQLKSSLQFSAKGCTRREACMSASSHMLPP